MDLDDFDRQLLARVQADASLTAEQLAEAVALSPSAIQRRLRRLREGGVIEREVAVLDPGRVGSPASFITSLYLHHERPDQVRNPAPRPGSRTRRTAGLLRDRRG